MLFTILPFGRDAAGIPPVLLLQLEEFYQERSCFGDPAKRDAFFSGPEELIWKNMREERREIVLPALYDVEHYIKEWLSESYEKKGFDDDAPELITDGGIRVRSKTEFIIAGIRDSFYFIR